MLEEKASQRLMFCVFFFFFFGWGIKILFYIKQSGLSLFKHRVWQTKEVCCHVMRGYFKQVTIVVMDSVFCFFYCLFYHSVTVIASKWVKYNMDENKYNMYLDEIWMKINII